jgi:hypothetical protein
LRTVKGMYAIHGKQRKPALLPQLLFDSLQTPMLAGVRATASDVRQLLYGSGSYRIELRLEPQMDSDLISVAGQVLNLVDPEAAVKGVPVKLLRDRKVVGTSTTNRFGEFRFDTPLEQNLQLQVSIPQGPDFSVPLVDPVTGSSAETEVTDIGRVKKLLRRTQKSTRKKV